jgi:hypothetical protein
LVPVEAGQVRFKLPPCGFAQLFIKDILPVAIFPCLIAHLPRPCTRFFAVELIPNLPEMHVDELRQRVVLSAMRRDAFSLGEKNVEILPAEAQNTLDKVPVRAGVTEVFVPKAIDEIPIAGRQTSQ